MDLSGTEKRPLAERIRPAELADFVGQTHVVARLTTMLNAPRLPSLLLFGPPGCGKSTLALILARAKGKPYIRVSAPEAGLAVLREKIKGKEILILDELHRFSKAQQDFFLPLLETGDIVLLATTTENPSFSVTRQLLSRMHVLRLRPLSHSELMSLAARGAKAAGIELSRESLDRRGVALFRRRPHPAQPHGIRGRPARGQARAGGSAQGAARSPGPGRPGRRCPTMSWPRP